jgi:tRNA dimethylallyltransferase
VTPPPLLVIAGATATGKTGISVRLARTLADEGIAAEIISADSRQVYRGLDIGTAKVSVAERGGIPHHGLDLADPDATVTLADYASHARAALAGIAGRGGLAILVGGTGLYLRAVARGIDTEALPADPVLRATLERALIDAGPEPLIARLRAISPRRAERVDLRNPRRIVRALEIAELSGDVDLPPPRGYDGPIAWTGLRLEHATHRDWIEARARRQFEAGLIEEARALRGRFDPGLPAFSAIGYREAWSVIDGEASLDEAIALDARRNVDFAKRQRTWFRAEPDIEWFDADGPDPLPRLIATVRGIAVGGGRPTRA